MKTQVLFCLLLAFGLALAKTDEYEQSFDDTKLDDTKLEPSDIANDDEKTFEETKNLKNDEETGEAPNKTMADTDSKSSSLVQFDEEAKHKAKGFCHWGINVWYKPGFAIRCSCMKCTCAKGSKWDCAFHFPYCPYYYCGNQIYNPATQICCCGKVHAKKRFFACCGHFYYDTRANKCCNYYTVKSKKANCPRYRV